MRADWFAPAQRRPIRSDTEYNSLPMKNNVWEFVRNENGNCAVFHNGKPLADAIPEERREDEFCLRFGFCGHRFEEIVRQLQESGKCTLHL